MNRIVLPEAIEDHTLLENPFGPLKQLLLVFDGIALGGVKPWADVKYGSETLSVLDFLMQRGALHYYVFDEESLKETAERMMERALIDSSVLGGSHDIPNTVNELFEKLGEAIAGVFAFLHEQISSRVEKELGPDSIVVPSYGDVPRRWQVARSAVETRSCLSIVFKQFPMPGPDVSLQDILDFREDSEMKRKRVRLFSWLNDINSPGVDLRAFSETLEILVAEYYESLNLLTRKFQFHVARTIVSAPFRVISDVVKLDLKVIPDIAFEILELPLLKKELMSGVKHVELAYIGETRKRFGVHP